MERLLDFTQPFDVNLLDSVVRVFYECPPGTTKEQQKTAERVLTALKEHPESWRVADKILVGSTNPNSRFLALQILEVTIKVNNNNNNNNEKKKKREALSLLNSFFFVVFVLHTSLFF